MPPFAGPARRGALVGSWPCPSQRARFCPWNASPCDCPKRALLLSFCPRAFSFSSRMTCCRAPRKTSPSSCTKERASTRPSLGTTWGRGTNLTFKVLQAFVEPHEFADLNLVQALRQFPWSFRLPGEAQKIDRMMEAFASRYCLRNPGVFQSQTRATCCPSPSSCSTPACTTTTCGTSPPRSASSP